MSFEIVVTQSFDRSLKRLSKKFPSLASDLRNLGKTLSENPNSGKSLGRNVYKIRLAVKSKGKGKSGGARVITYVKVTAKTVYLLDIYDKSEMESLTDFEISALLHNLDLT